MNSNDEYKQSTQKLINTLIYNAENHTDMKIMETIVKDERDLVEEEPADYRTPVSAIGSSINMK
jgi:hypothetical protein